MGYASDIIWYHYTNKTSEDELQLEFPAFKRLHKLLCTRPNVVPPAVTTGVGPGGRKTNHYQATEEHLQQSNQDTQLLMDDSMIDPQLLPTPGIQQPIATPPAEELTASITPVDVHPSFATMMMSPSPSPSRPSFNEDRQQLPAGHAAPRTSVSQTSSQASDKENAPPPASLTPTAIQSTPARGRDALANAIRKVDSASSVKRIPAKRTFEDNLLEMHRENLQFSKQKAEGEVNLKKRKNYMQEREFLSRQRTSYRKDYDEDLMTQKLKELDNMDL
ncbi:hypothetical protein SCHPADRAFT_766720 [Schizopora paradoxa]|uniref:Uncharacterized protein n=1 Tax=Schizopora paradoxa TaxID=27342 RepID=A0A0H2R2S4_9AGAM|nr:hypothetical protein SCHPADRAFT_766720 [Schizopora paradoxa]